MLLPILKAPDPRLYRVATPVTQFNRQLIKLAADMVETMDAANGIGLAAPQVGVSRRIIALGAEVTPSGAPLVLVNPRIDLTLGTCQINEQCLSAPGVTASPTRAAAIRLTAHTPAGALTTVELVGLAAVVAQHEIDHLNGIVISNTAL